MEIGVGSGAIACALAKELPGCRIIATDISPTALALAQKNATRLGVANQIKFIAGDLLDGVANRFDVIVANLPYIASDEYESLPMDIRGYEPKLALCGGADGLEIIRRLIGKARDFLLPNGWLALEVGAAQGKVVSELLITNGYAKVRIIKDLAGWERVVLAVNA